MNSVYIGKGKLAGKGVYANRDFKSGEVVMFYNLIELTHEDFHQLPHNEKKFVHSFWGKMYLFPEPSRYTNHSADPNTKQDVNRMCDIAIRDIKKGEMITTNATEEIKNELITFIEALEKTKQIRDFTWLKGAYRNAVVSYTVPNAKNNIRTLKRVNGNWCVL